MTTSKPVHESSQDSLPSGKNEPNRMSPWALISISLGITLGVSFVAGIVQWLQEEKTRLLFIGLDGMCFYLAFGFSTFVAIGIGVAYFRPSKRLILMSVALISTAYYGFSSLVKIDGYFGNRTPRYTWVWTPKAEDEIKTYFTSRTTFELPVPAEDLFLPGEGDSPELLGPGRSGKVPHLNLASNWEDRQPELLWRHPVGLGWSGFSIVGNGAVNLEQREEKECVVCYDLQSGRELWCHGENVRFNHEHGDGPRTTPTIHKGRVYSFGATGILTCVDFKTGCLVWKQSSFLDPEKENLMFGMSGSPLVVNDMVIVTPGAGLGASAIAYSIDTGSEAWRCGDDPASYASPVAVSLCDRNQILSFNGAGLRSYSELGRNLWLQPWVTQGDSRVNVAQPIVLAGSDIDQSIGTEDSDSQWAKVLISSGYDKGTALLKITRTGDRWTSEVVWESKQLKSKLSNFVVYDNHAYGLDNGILTCIGLKDGERVWKRGRYGHGKILLVHDKLLIQAESGEIVMVAATPTLHLELAKFEALSSKTWNNHALAGDILVVRNDREAAAIRLPVTD